MWTVVCRIPLRNENVLIHCDTVTHEMYLAGYNACIYFSIGKGAGEML